MAISKIKEKAEAIKLREKGFSYNEILKEVTVAKSTLSLWLRSVGLSQKQKQRLTKKKLESMRRGWEARRQKRINDTKKIKDSARKEIGTINKKELWLIGTALYWAEGLKEKSRAVNFQFGNLDPEMIKLFLKWVQEICKISRDDIRFEIYLHRNAKKREREVREYWARVTGFPVVRLQRIFWKKHIIKTNRKNIGKTYFGLLKVTIARSSSLTRRVAGWIEGICQNSL